LISESLNKNMWKILIDSFKKFIDENSFQDAAAIAFYTIFSFPGIAIISVTIASGFFYEHEQVKNELLKQMTLLMGQSSEKYIKIMLNASLFSGESLFMKVIGSALLLISTTTVFISLQESLNKIWNIKPKPKRFILKLIANRVLSFSFVASTGLVLLVSLMMDTMIALFKVSILDYFADISIYIVTMINFVFSEAIAVLVFASIYKVLPDVRIQWKDVWVGATVTTILFTVGKTLIAYYLRSADFNSAYGAAGSLVAMLAWVYYSMLILFFGAQFTFVYTNNMGRKILPGKDAVEVKVVEVK
jgi:membrane protein